MSRHTLLLLSATFLVSFASLFAKLIDMSANSITWWRCLVACLLLGLILAYRNELSLPSGSRLWMIISGSLLGIHWWTFFLSIQLSSVPVGVLTLFTFPLMVALMEPYTLKVPVSIRQILGGIGIVGGVYFLMPEFSFDNSITRGVLIGLFSALLYAIRNLLTKKYLPAVPAMTTLFYQMLSSLGILSLVIFASSQTLSIPSEKDLLELFMLAIVFTIGGHGLMTYCLKLFSASTVGIVSSLQVGFSSLMAFLILGEIPDRNVYIGALIILSIAVYELLPRKNINRNDQTINGTEK